MLSGVGQMSAFVQKQIFTERKSNRSESMRSSDLSRVVFLLEDPLSASFKERHIFILKKFVKRCQRGFLLRDLADIFKILNLCAERLTHHPEYVKILHDLLQICGLPFLKEKSSDEMNYANVVTDCLSQMGYLMRIPNPEVRHQICSSIISFYSHEKPKHSLDGVCPIRAAYRGQMVERSGLAETLVMSLALMENQLSVKLRLLHTLQILSRTSEVNCNLMLRAHAAQKICFHMSEPDPTGQVLFRSTEILWNLLENGSSVEVTSQLSSIDSIVSLKEAFIHQLLNGRGTYDQQLRNDLLVLTSLIAGQTNTPLIESGFVKQLTQFVTFPELKSHNPLVRNLKLTFSHEDFEMKKLMLNLIVVLSKDLAALQLFKEGRVMLALMVLIKPKSSEVQTSRRSWTSSQQEELQLQALATLSALAPLLLDDYMMCQTSTCLLLLLERCVQEDSCCVFSGLKLQVRCCVQVIRCVVCVGSELVKQDLCDQGAVSQLLGVLRWCLHTQDIVSLEIQMDTQLILSVLCDGHQHRKELFGSEGVDMLIQYLSLDSVLMFSGLGHNKLLLSTVDCVWSCVVGYIRTEEMFIERHGVHILLQLLQSSPSHMHTVLIAALLELSDNPQALSHLLLWRGGGGVSGPAVLLQIWRREEEEMRVRRDQQGRITDVKRPIMSEYQELNSSSHHISPAIRDVSENLRANIYCMFCKLGFEGLQGLSAGDDITLSIMRRYLDFKMGEVWAEVSADLCLERLTPVFSDAEALNTVIQMNEDAALHVCTLQQSILDRQEQKDLHEERLLYKEITSNHEQKKLTAEAWRNFVARTSDYIILKNFRKFQQESVESFRAAGRPESFTHTSGLQTTTFCGRAVSDDRDAPPNSNISDQ